MRDVAGPLVQSKDLLRPRDRLLGLAHREVRHEAVRRDDEAALAAELLHLAHGTGAVTRVLIVLTTIVVVGAMFIAIGQIVAAAIHS